MIIIIHTIIIKIFCHDSKIIQTLHKVELREHILKGHFKILDDKSVFFASFKDIKVKKDDIVFLVIG